MIGRIQTGDTQTHRDTHTHVHREKELETFLPRDVMLSQYVLCRNRIVLCLSVTSRCSTETAKRRITQTTPHDSQGTLVF